MALIVKCNNGIVTDKYLELIGKALGSLDQSVVYTNDLSDAFKMDKEEIIVVARIVEAYRLVRRGYKRVIMWFQGIEPEESYMAHHSKVRYWVLNHMEKKVLKYAFFCVFVSNEMIRHYKIKYGFHKEDKHFYIMPCQNTRLHPEAFEEQEKYKKNIFAYIGSMAVWQRFEDTVIAYKKLEESGIEDSEFRVYTAEKEVAKKLLLKHEVKNYHIDYVKNEDLPKELSLVKYGFILREDNAVNRVATPTKISTYLSCGLIPIYSMCLVDFDEMAKKMKYCICAENGIMEKVIEWNKFSIDKESIYNEYKSIFDKYYNEEMHMERLKMQLSELI